jgi:adenosylhomocysteinase
LLEVFTQPDGKRITVLAQGEMLNLAGGGGNPVETMDLGLALQALSLRYLAKRHKELPHEPQPVPREINIEVARAMVEILSRT